MQLGTIVRYTPQPGPDDAESYPAIVMGEWPNGSLQLYVMQFDHPTNIRAAHPSQVGIMLSPDQLFDLDLLVNRLLTTAKNQERRIVALERREANNGQIGGSGQLGVEPTPVKLIPESDRMPVPEAEPEKEDNITVLAEPIPTRRSRWPKHGTD